MSDHDEAAEWLTVEDIEVIKVLKVAFLEIQIEGELLSREVHCVQCEMLFPR